MAPKWRQETPGKCPDKTCRGSVKAPKQRPDKAPRPALRRPQRKAEEGSGRSPRVAPKLPLRGAPTGPKMPQTERQTGPQKSPTAPGGLHQGAKWRPQMVSGEAAKRFKKMVQYCVEVNPQMAPKGAQKRPQDGSKRA